MNESALELAQVATRFPILAGDTFRDGNEVRHSLDSVIVVMTSADGVERTIRLQRRSDGQWWAPSTEPT